MIDFFISYSSADEEWARTIDRWLNEWGYQTWLAARDERGRWGPELERALASARRLVAVLSPAYETSEWCEREWRTVAAGDPDGALDLVVVVRIAEGRSDGPLNGFHRVDAVAASREEVRERLKQRLRRTDTEAPQFQPTPKAQVYDADVAALRSVQATVARWREQFGPKEAAVQAIRDRVTRWRSKADTPSDEELVEVAEAARAIAAALRGLPVQSMMPALGFGLVANPMLVEHGTYLDVGSESRDDYQLECLNRVFDAALAIAHFDDSRMPRGLADVPHGRLDLPLDAPIFLLTTSHRGEPRAFTFDPELRWLGTLQARAHGVSLLCASRDLGGLHAVAHDDEEIVVWSASQVLPATVIRHPARVITATMRGAEALLVDESGRLFTVGPQGKSTEYARRQPEGKTWRTAALPSCGEELSDAWVALADLDVLSLGTTRAERARVPARELAVCSGVESPMPDVVSPLIRKVETGQFGGRQALVIEWGFGSLTEAVFTVHSPHDLQLLHPPIPFGQVAGASLLAGRYLVVSRLSGGTDRDSIATFDLSDPGIAPAGEAAYGRYEAYVFYDLPEREPACCLFALRDWVASSDQRYRLTTLEYPAGVLCSHGSFPDLRLTPVIEARPR